MKWILNISFLIMLNIAGFSQEVNSCYIEVDCQDFNLIMKNKNPFIVDVRFQRAYKKERITGAQNATDKIALKVLLNNVDKDKIVLVYCKEGKRSRTASEIICNDLNFKNVYTLNNGFKDWKKKGYPTKLN